MSGRKGMRRVPRGTSVLDRLAFHSVDAPSGCRIWTGARDDKGGYGRIQVDGSTKYAHRESYELHVGPIPDGHQIDHLCRYPRCINPRHLQAVTPSVNVRRGTSPGARAIRGNGCNRGHSYDDGNAYINSGRRYCRICTRQRKELYRAQAGAA